MLLSMPELGWVGRCESAMCDVAMDDANSVWLDRNEANDAGGDGNAGLSPLPGVASIPVVAIGTASVVSQSSC